MAPPLAINKFDIFFGIWPTMVSSLSTAMAYLSTSLNSLLQSWQPVYLCKRDNLACRIPFRTLPCFISYHTYVTGKLRVLGLK